MIQIDMEMPKSCEECPFSNSSQDNCSLLWIDSIRHSSTGCPLKEVSVGRWIKMENWMDVGIRVKCSECGQVFVLGDQVSRNYCGNCGAKMDKVEDDGTN